MPLHFSRDLTLIFSYAPSIRHAFPELATRVLLLEGLIPEPPPTEAVASFVEFAKQRIALTGESSLPEIQAWRRAFSKMGLRPTQYRCGSEALLRRLRKEGDLPSIHPLIDLCNAVSVAFATPIAVIDLSKINGNLQVRHAIGTETYESFTGEVEQPEVGEIIFVDDIQCAHARRWSNRQSRHSAVNTKTTSALIVAEAMHDTAETDVDRLMMTLRMTLLTLWPSTSITEVLVS